MSDLLTQGKLKRLAIAVKEEDDIEKLKELLSQALLLLDRIMYEISTRLTALE